MELVLLYTCDVFGHGGIYLSRVKRAHAAEGKSLYVILGADGSGCKALCQTSTGGLIGSVLLSNFLRFANRMSL